MDTNFSSELAHQIVHQQIVQNWELYALILSLLFVATIAGSFLGTYARRRGEQFATKVNMENLLYQLEKKTETTKSIESRISMDEWTLKERAAIRRHKLEELVLSTAKLDEWLSTRSEQYLNEAKIFHEESPLPLIRLLVTLYFPELRQEAHWLADGYRNYMTWLMDHTLRLKAAKKQGAMAHQIAWNECVAEFTDVYNPIAKASASIAMRAGDIMQALLTDVAGRPRQSAPHTGSAEPTP
jgi:hypothetical protein